MFGAHVHRTNPWPLLAGLLPPLRSVGKEAVSGFLPVLSQGLSPVQGSPATGTQHTTLPREALSKALLNELNDPETILLSKTSQGVLRKPKLRWYRMP